MKSTAREIIYEAQAGFTVGHGTLERISNMRNIKEKQIDHQNYIFIDFKKAFDRVWHEALRLTMLKHNFSPDMVSVIKPQYEDKKRMVLKGDKNSHMSALDKDVCYHPHSSVFSLKKF